MGCCNSDDSGEPNNSTRNVIILGVSLCVSFGVRNRRPTGLAADLALCPVPPRAFAAAPSRRPCSWRLDS